MLSFSILAATVAAVFAAPQNAISGFTCPDNGVYPHATRCDIYYDCATGVATEHLCPDGLVFDQSGRKCEYTFLTSDRECDYYNPANMQPAQGTTVQCPRLNGYFMHEDESNCREYYWCSNGTPTKQKCNEGLHFDEFRGSCNWASENFRTGCVDKQTQLEDGFQCPTDVQLATNGQGLDHALYTDESDCRNFYICHNGKEPTKNGCPDGTVFNDVELRCDEPSNVPGCTEYYGDSGIQVRRRR